MAGTEQQDCLQLGCVIATGIHQHSAMYEKFAERLAEEGFPTLVYDHRGFGRSPSYEKQIEERAREAIIALLIEQLEVDPKFIQVEMPSGEDGDGSELSFRVAIHSDEEDDIAAQSLLNSESFWASVNEKLCTVDGTSCERSMIPQWHKLGDPRNPSATGDLMGMVDYAKTNFGVRKVFVFGHSLGGLIAGLLGTLPNNECNADGFILSNPSLQNPWAGLIDELKQNADADPHQANGRFSGDVQKMASNNQDFIDFWNSEDISAFVEDGRPFKAGYQLEANYAIEEVRARFANFKAPVLLLRGEADDFEQGACADLIAGCEHNYANTSPDDLVLKSYPGMAHEILFEEGLDMGPGKNKVVDDVIEWMKRSRLRLAE
jgi:alpha-beta hydrolase superfamily lysophospholipase